MLISSRGRYALLVMIDLAEHRTGGFIPVKETAARLADAPGALLDAVRGVAAAKGNPGSGESGD